MKYVVLLVIVALLMAAGYGYQKNPKACRKLGLDIVNDTQAFFNSPDSTTSTQDQTPVADASPAVPVVAPSPPVDSLAGSLLQNGDFSTGNRLWEGDGTINIRYGKGLAIPLSGNAWTKVSQDFSGNQGTADTVVLIYQVSPDCTVSTNPSDYADVINQIQFEDYKRYSPMNLPVGDFLVWVGDLTNGGSRYEPIHLQFKPGETQTFKHTFPKSLPNANKVIVLAFPPGTGNVLILSVSLKSN